MRVQLAEDVRLDDANRKFSGGLWAPKWADRVLWIDWLSESVTRATRNELDEQRTWIGVIENERGDLMVKMQLSSRRDLWNCCLKIEVVYIEVRLMISRGREAASTDWTASS